MRDCVPRAAWPRVLVWCEAAALAALAAGLLWLPLSEAYWYFLNPKFKPLTLAAGAVALAAALAHPWGRGRGKRSSLGSMLLFLGLAAWAVAAVLGSAGAAGPAPDAAPQSTVLNGFDAGPPPGPSPTFDGAPLPDPGRLEYQGREFVKLNLMELWLLADDPKAGPPERLALRGRVFPLAGKTDRFVLSRIAVTCCLADAVAVSFVVEGKVPQGVAQGDWVRLLGGLVPLDGRAPALGEVMHPGVSMTVVHEESMLRAESVETVPPPPIPFMFDYRAEEPFVY